MVFSIFVLVYIQVALQMLRTEYVPIICFAHITYRMISLVNIYIILSFSIGFHLVCVLTKAYLVFYTLIYNRSLDLFYVHDRFTFFFFLMLHYVN